MNVSVVIPCFNGEAFLAQTIRSVLNQTHRAAEIIVADNGSSDDSPAIARSFGDAVTTITAPERGASAARIAGVARATGDAIMFLDADDLLGPDTLGAMVAVLAQRPDAVACCPWVRFEPAPEGWRVAPPSCPPRRPGQDDLSAWLTGWYHPPCSVLWSRAAYERSGGWDPEIGVNDDGDIMMRGLVAGNALVPAAAGTGYYRRLPSEMTSLSGTRATRTGVESRLAVLDRVAALLTEQERLAHYGSPLAEAYAAIAPDAAQAMPDLAARCRAAVARYRAVAPRKQRWSSGAARHYVTTTGPLRRRISLRGPAALRPPARPDTAKPSDKAGTPLVSVVIPAYNRAATLPRAIASVLDQDYPRIELFVVDDCSTDDTAGILGQYDDSRLHVLHQPVNQGVAAARNRGMRAATGDFIAFLDSDDEWLPGKLARQVARFGGASDRLGLVYTGTETIEGDGRRVVDTPRHRGDLHAALLVRNVLHGGGSNALIRREVIDTVGVFDTALPAIEDYDYWVRIARFYDFDVVSDPLARYHDAADQDDTRRSRNFAANMTARRMFFERFGHEMRRAGVDHRFLLDSAQRHLASPEGSRLAAMTLTAKAAARRPLALRSYPWLPFALLPRKLGARLQDGVRSLRGKATSAQPETPA